MSAKRERKTDDLSNPLVFYDEYDDGEGENWLYPDWLEYPKW